MINFIENSHKEKKNNQFGKLNFKNTKICQLQVEVHKRNIQLTCK